jgi:lipopolysaccharide transport system ATP-binding protein
MSDVAIRVEGLGKQYRLGGRGTYQTLRERINGLCAAPLRRFRKRAGAPGRAAAAFWALKDVSFEVKQGEVLGIIGRNGAGKSTLLKVLSRITEPTEGEADLCGRVGSLLEVGTGFHQELTGRENVYLNGAILGMRRAEIAARFDEIVAFAEVEKFVDTPVKHYSSGMYMRLAFAVAAHLSPEILIVDEVLAVGDAEFQKKCLGKMGEVARGGRTVLFVSHNMGAIQSLCGRAVILQQGRALLIGPTAEVVPQYLATEALSQTFERPGGVDGPVGIAAAAVEVAGNGDKTVLRVKTWVRSAVAVKVSIDLRVGDAVGAPLGFAAVGSFNESQEVRLVPGVTCVTSVHDVSVLANGAYTLSIDVASPTFGYHDRAEQCLTFDVHAPSSAGCYRRLQQSWGLGAVEFPYQEHAVA